jgi:hypothetical protein
MSLPHGSWTFASIDGADVRLRTGDVGLLDVDVTAPVRSGELHISAGKASMSLVVALDQLKTGNFLTEHAARSFITGNGAHDLVYDGSGAAQQMPFAIAGQAKAGALDLAIGLTVTLFGGSQPTDAELTGSTNFGRVHIPIPGVGTIENLTIAIDAKLALR